MLRASSGFLLSYLQVRAGGRVRTFVWLNSNAAARARAAIAALAALPRLDILC